MPCETIDHKGFRMRVVIIGAGVAGAAAARALRGYGHHPTVLEAADVMAMLTAPSVYHRLVTQQGWSRARFRRWMTNTLLEQLLKPKPKPS